MHILEEHENWAFDLSGKQHKMSSTIMVKRDMCRTEDYTEMEKIQKLR